MPSAASGRFGSTIRPRPSLSALPPVASAVAGHAASVDHVAAEGQVARRRPCERPPRAALRRARDRAAGLHAVDVEQDLGAREGEALHGRAQRAGGAAARPGEKGAGLLPEEGQVVDTVADDLAGAGPVGQAAAVLPGRGVGGAVRGTPAGPLGAHAGLAVVVAYGEAGVALEAVEVVEHGAAAALDVHAGLAVGEGREAHLRHRAVARQQGVAALARSRTSETCTSKSVGRAASPKTVMPRLPLRRTLHVGHTRGGR